MSGRQSSGPTHADPIPVEAGVPQLFVDDYLIESEYGLTRTLHQPRKDDGGNVPVIAITDEFDGVPATLEANGSIVYDPRLAKWVMIALAFASSMTGPDRARLYRYTSDDAIHWTRGDNGTAQWIEFDLIDPESGVQASNIDVFCCFYDETDAEYPYQGWLAFANWGGTREGTYFVRSRDGRRWTRGTQTLRFGPCTIDGRAVYGPHDVSLFTQDPKTGRFLANMKFYNQHAVAEGNLQRARAYLFIDRIDQPIDTTQLLRIALVPPAAETNGDHLYDEYYASDSWRYGNQWLGALKIWHDAGDYPYSAAGAAYLKLVSSRDGLDWRKVQFTNEDGVPEVWLPNGQQGGNNGRNDGGYMSLFNQGPLRIGNELVYYYGASSIGKDDTDLARVTGGGIFRARLRLDGFVSVDSGTITTNPLAFDGSDLVVNGVGPITIDVLPATGNRVLGRARLSGDSVGHQVSFEGGANVGKLSDGTARLRFSVGNDGKLYSFSIN